MNYSTIKYNDIANGPGIRISLFVSGCTNHCDGCFNKETWSFEYGNKFTEDIKNEIIENLGQKRYKGITILGGEPFELQNQPTVLSLIKEVRNKYPNKDIWIYSGFVYEKDLISNGKRYIDGITNEILSNADILVDGKFDKNLYDISLKFRGSSNQRIINLQKSTPENIVMWDNQ